MIPEFVTWYDSASHGDGWHDLAEIENTVETLGLLRIETVGWVVHENEDAVTLALAWSPDADGNPLRIAQPLTIPKFAIHSRRAAISKGEAVA